MKLKLKLLNYLFIVLAVLAVSCEKDDSSPEEKESIQDKGFTFDNEAVMNKVPENLKNSDDQYAKMCVDYVESAMDMSAFVSQLTPPENATLVEMKSAEASGTYTWQFNGYGIYWTYSEEGEKAIWSVDIEIEGKKYDYIDAWQLKDGSKGEVKYNFNYVCAYAGQQTTDCETLLAKYTWELKDDGSYKFLYTYDSNSTEYDYAFKYEVVINKDGSGAIDYVTNDFVLYHMEWDAEGNGSWTYMNGSNTGSWTV
ncbi:MAG: hypothetical protein MI922_00180 [Bacteroidales bacterium]|nr:hypothetical protein [Bacteroidales bacterium]